MHGWVLIFNFYVQINYAILSITFGVIYHPINPCKDFSQALFEPGHEGERRVMNGVAVNECPSTNKIVCSSPRKAKILTSGIREVCLRIKI